MDRMRLLPGERDVHRMKIARAGPSVPSIRLAVGRVDQEPAAAWMRSDPLARLPADPSAS